MKKSRFAFTVVLLLAASAATAFAGLKSKDEVRIVTGGAQGSIGSARASADHNQSIGCSVMASSSGTSASCFASDASNVFAGCTVPMPSGQAMVAVIESIGSQSDVSFAFDNAGNCTTVTVRNVSYYQPAVQ